MALDVMVDVPLPGGATAPGPRVSLVDDGYYWFLNPLFHALAERTGRRIDLHGDAVFRPAELAALERTMADARERVGAQPGRWQVCCGMRMFPVRREVVETVERAAFLQLLDALDEAIAAARAGGGSVQFLGD